MKHSTSQRVALVYDRVNTFGGAERVLCALHEIYPDAPLYTSVYEPSRTPWTKGWTVIPSFLQRIPWLRTRHQYLALLMPLAFESFDFSSYDLVISVTSEAAKGVITKTSTRHVCYVLTPTRYLWSNARGYEHDYFVGWKKILLPFSRLAMKYLRTWDKIAAQRPDSIIAISRAVANRTQQFYGRKAQVLFPPFQANIFKTKPIHGSHALSFSSFYLCVGRLVPYKRIDLAISACLALGRNLVIVGTGSDLQRLQRLSQGAKNIFFAGSLTDQELVRYYQQCTALLFPGEEDFGLTVLEAMMAGKPVVVYAKSGHTETVLEGITGVIFKQQRKDAIIEAITATERRAWDSNRIHRHALQFDQSRWKQQWRSAL